MRPPNERDVRQRYEREHHFGRREVINGGGGEGCEILIRWTLLDLKMKNRSLCKVMVHRFLPMASDRDCHDHPASFITFVLKGMYWDHTPDGRIETVRAPAVRFRRAEHQHSTVTGLAGAWTLVLMGPKRRRWGFWRDGSFYDWHEYVWRFGAAMRCDDD